ncbi:solute carrier family 25 member 38 [Bisporella sp. PMI_857]|nr:solute carrier family 25 member 38 [Bisporella sp. PMI_857]
MSNGAPPQKSKSSASFHFLAGASSGVLSAVLLQPADLLKTRIQQSNHRSLLATIRSISSSPNTTFLSFWRGTLPSALRTGLGSALYFTSLNALRQHVARSNLLSSLTVPILQNGSARTIYSSSSLPKLGNLANLTTGAIARASAGFVLMPMTVIKVRYESDLYAYRSIASAGRDIYLTAGLRGFFAGFGATAIRDAPYAGLYVLFYEQLKKRLSVFSSSPSSHPLNPSIATSQPLQMKVSTSTTINFASGVLAAGAATAITNPFDAVKTRIQLQPGRYRNLVQGGGRMVREEGWRCLFDGLGLRMGRKAMSSALAWTVYEELIRRAESAWKTPVESNVL